MRSTVEVRAVSGPDRRELVQFAYGPPDRMPLSQRDQRLRVPKHCKCSTVSQVLFRRVPKRPRCFARLGASEDCGVNVDDRAADARPSLLSRKQMQHCGCGRFPIEADRVATRPTSFAPGRCAAPCPQRTAGVAPGPWAPRRHRARGGRGARKGLALHRGPGPGAPRGARRRGARKGLRALHRGSGPRGATGYRGLGFGPGDTFPLLVGFTLVAN